jgi:hypothetical protein
MLADNRIKLLDLHFVWHVLLILSRGVKVTCPCRGHQLDFISHDSLPAQPGSRLLFVVDELDSLPLLAQIRNHLLNPQLIDQTHALGWDFQLHEATLAFQPKPMLLNVRQKSTPCFVVRVRDVVSALWALPGYLTHSGHHFTLFKLG